VNSPLLENLISLLNVELVNVEAYYPPLSLYIRCFQFPLARSWLGHPVGNSHLPPTASAFEFSNIKPSVTDGPVVIFLALS